MITIESSWGIITTNDDGNVIEKDLYSDEPCYLMDVVKFDISEFDSWYESRFETPSPKPSEFDVLWVGYWKSDGIYYPANAEIRNDMFPLK